MVRCSEPCNRAGAEGSVGRDLMHSWGQGGITVEVVPRPWAEQKGPPWVPKGTASFLSPKLLKQKLGGPSSWGL